MDLDYRKQFDKYENDNLEIMKIVSVQMKTDIEIRKAFDDNQEAIPSESQWSAWVTELKTLGAAVEGREAIMDQNQYQRQQDIAALMRPFCMHRWKYANEDRYNQLEKCDICCSRRQIRKYYEYTTELRSYH